MSKNDEMSLMGHLTELRRRLTVVILANLVGAMLLFNAAQRLMSYLLALKPETMQLVYIGPSELLLVYIKLAFLMALVLCSPITLYEIWAFLEKGLYKHEKVCILTALFFGLICFVIGAAFCYYSVLPITLNFFVRIAIEEVSAMISVKEYASFVNSMLLAFGVIFEMPVLVFLLSRLEIIKPEMLRKNRNIAIVLIFVVAALLTPPDVVSQTMLALPMLLLLEISIAVSSAVDKRNKKRHAKQEAKAEKAAKKAAQKGEPDAAVSAGTD